MGRLAAVLALVAALAAASAVRAADLTLKLAHVAPPTSSYQTAAERLNTHLKRLSSGTAELEIVPGGTLGSLPQLWAQLRAGSLDMHLTDINALPAIREAKAFSLLNMPYLLKDEAEWDRFLASPVFAEMMGEVEKTVGIKYVGYLGYRPPRALTTSKTPVRKLDDIKGLKIRVPETPAIVEAFKAFGAAPTPIKASEIYTALQTGLVDGQDNGIIDVVAAGWTEVQKYYSPIDYVQAGIGAWISGRKWASLGDAQKTALTEAAKAAAADARREYPQELQRAVAAAKAKGMEFVEVDKSGFERVGAELIAAKDGVDWPKGYAERARQGQ